MKSMYGTLYVDIDAMQKINGDFGHDVGDTFLSIFEEKLEKVCQPYAITPFRVSGDEFIAIVPEKYAEKTFKLASLILKELSSKDITIKPYTFRYTISVGAIKNKNTKNCIDLVWPSWVFEMAKESCAFAKYGGRDRVVQIDLVVDNNA